MKSKIFYLSLFLWLGAFGSFLTAQLTVVSGTTITIVDGTTVDFVGGDLINNGIISGKGTLTADGTYTHNGTIAISIGPDQNTHTTLTIGGAVTITSGDFTVTTESYTPSNNDQATIITSSGSIAGTFSNAISNSWTANYELPLSGDFTIAYGTVLPVDLLFFSGEVVEKEIQLNWRTASELNNSGFEIQHSSEGKNWRNIGFVEGIGTTVLEESYSYIHERPLLGDNYYRLKQIDFDGKIKFSDVRHVLFHSDEVVHLNVYPNPTSSAFHVRIFNPEKERVLLKLFDSRGQMIETKSWLRNTMPESWEETFLLEHKEIYNVMVQVGTQLETKKVSVVSIK